MKIKPSRFLKELSLLYVEDESAVREIFYEMMKRYFKKVFVAKDGEEGLELFKKHDPDIVITDIRMPKMNGLKMVEEIKKIDSEAFVIFITAFSDSEYLKEALELGAEGYMIKPLNKHKLIEKLNHLAKMIHHKKEQQAYFELLKMLFEQYEDAIVLLENDHIKLYNQKFFNIFGALTTLEELMKKFEKPFSLDNEKEIIELSNGNVKFFEKIVKKVQDYIIITFQDITEFQNEIFIDNLTNVYNRKYLKAVLEQFFHKKICIIFFDIDNFKKINDTYGHKIGDHVLEKIAKIVKNNLRRYDKIIRWGGEEFLILLDGVDNIDIAEKIANFLRIKIIESDFGINENITCSFGVGCAMINTEKDFDVLFEKVDKALYKAKKEGKNRVKIVENGSVQDTIS